MKKENKFRAWAVVWRKSAEKSYGVQENEIVVFVDLSGNTDNSLSIFRTRKEATKYIGKNRDWKIKKATIAYNAKS